MNDYMNSPEEPEVGVIYAETVWYGGNRWIRCPICGKRQFMLTPMTKIEHLWHKCKNTKCKVDMMINVR